ncbi:MAG: dihydroorotase [Gemmatimonadetes bacterium]|nr:dihydroorotase [Gemmatimonadota bacterium]
MTALLISGGRVIDPTRGTDGPADVLVDEGRIVAVGHNIPLGPGVARLDASGRVVAPGLVDLHVHFREPGQEHLETIASGATAAAAGGFTAVCAMPNTDPVVDNQAAVGFVVRQAIRAGKARVYPIGCISLGQKGQQLAEFGEMVAAGAVAVSDDTRPVVSSQLMRTALEYAQTFGIPVTDHCEDPSLAQGGVMHEGLVATRLGLKGIPAAAEEVVVARNIVLARLTGGHLHVCHVSTAGAVELIRRAKDLGVRVTAEATPHHLALTDLACEGYQTSAKVRPPLRSAEDRAAIVAGLVDGTIDCIATDHSPQHYDAKEREFDEAAAGVVGLETALPVALAELVKPGHLSLLGLIDRMSTAPARLYGLSGGSLAVGAPADIVIFDPNAAWRPQASDLHSKSANSPFLGREFVGRVDQTLVGGRVVFDRSVKNIDG